MDYRSALVTELDSHLSTYEREDLHITEVIKVLNETYTRKDGQTKTSTSNPISDTLALIHEDLKEYWTEFGFFNSSKQENFVKTVGSLMTLHEYKPFVIQHTVDSNQTNQLLNPVSTALEEVVEYTPVQQ